MTGGVGWNNRAVLDAFENRDYAGYVWRTVGDKKFWEVPPIKCAVRTASGDEQICNSKEEFDKLIKPFMDG